ncbi:MAG: hypothetical protein HY718_19115 [Planctomycetes bacterium]|nr:hypothetical protein [Planctomycetota bacterium]
MLNVLPGQATDPDPAHLATGVGLDADLSWSPGVLATSHRVHFGPSSPPEFKIAQAATTYDPGPLRLGTTCYWRIDEAGQWDTTTGNEWSFTTARYRGDVNDDGRVDQEGFGLLQACLSGQGVPQSDPACVRANLDDDNDVDQDDLTIFLQCTSGPAASPPLACLF